MQEILKDEKNHRGYDKEALFLMKAERICRDDMFQLINKLSRSFAPNCQELSASSNLKLLPFMITYGSDIKEKAFISQPSLAVSQLITYSVIARKLSKPLQLLRCVITLNKNIHYQ